jgi:uncharacterized protein
MTGSQRFQLMRDVPESLAGRVAIVELLPFSYAELLAAKQPGLGEILYDGFYPPVALDLPPTTAPH